MSHSFHLSIPVKAIDDSVFFFTVVLGGEVTHRDDTGYVNIDFLGHQITLKNCPKVSTDIPEFHFGLNMDLEKFEELASRLSSKYSQYIEMKPVVVDQGTHLERKKMYLKSPSGYLIEFKGYRK